MLEIGSILPKALLSSSKPLPDIVMKVVVNILIAVCGLLTAVIMKNRDNLVVFHKAKFSKKLIVQNVSHQRFLKFIILTFLIFHFSSLPSLFIVYPPLPPLPLPPPFHVM